MRVARQNLASHRIALCAAVLSACGLFPHASVAAELTGIVSLTSEYIYRGLLQSDGNPAFQFGLDYAFDSGIFVGAWASTMDRRSATNERDVELDYYLGYHYQTKSQFAATLSVLRYTYPGQVGTHSYDYDEVTFAASWRERYSIEFAYTKNLYGLESIGRHWELRSDWPVANVWAFSAGLGRNDLESVGVSRYLHWDIGASARFSRLVLDLRWYDNEPLAGYAARIAAGPRAVVSISTGF